MAGGGGLRPGLLPAMDETATTLKARKAAKAAVP